MLLLAGQGQEQHHPQVADKLDLGALRLQREDVVLIEHGHGFQGVVVPGVLAGVFVGHDVQGDLHHAGLPRQILRPGGDAVEGVVEGQRPGQVLERPGGLALKVEVVRGVAAEVEGSGVAAGDRLRAVRQVVDGVVSTVVGDGRSAVEGVALDHAALRQVAVVVQGGVIRLVKGGGDAVADGFRGGGGGDEGHRQRPGHGQRHPPEQRPARAGLSHKISLLKFYQQMSYKK